jgi:two-component sensor histidine kinase
MMTDAQFRISNITGDAEQLIREISKRTDLQQAAAEARTSVNGVVKSAAEELQNFRAAIDGETSNEQLIDLMRQAELIDPENVTGKVLSKKGILVTKALIRDTALQINELATNAAALRESGELTGNTYDRIVDRLVTLLDFHKYTA